jgi:uncharacterized membrane protein (DUF106 family)
MQNFNRAISSFFDLVISPFKTIDPIWSLALFSLLIGIIMLIIFRYTSNQQKIRETKSKIRAYIFELSLFKDEIGIVLSAQKNIFIYNLKYIKYALKSMLFMMVPLVLILIQLESWYGHRPLKPDESAIVSLKLREGGHTLSDITLKAGEGIIVETPPLRIPEQNEIDWRIRARETGDHDLTFNVPGEEIRQKVIVSEKGLVQVSRLASASASGFTDTLLNPALRHLPGDSQVEQIKIDYPAMSIEIYKWHVHWLVIVFVLSIVFGFALKGLFRVEI